MFSEQESCVHPKPVSAEGTGRLENGGRRGFMDAVTADLLALPWKRKGKYLPLAMLLPHIGVGTVLRLHPTVLPDILAALAEETLGCAASATVRNAG
jgi:hypothetical protein